MAADSMAGDVENFVRGGAGASMNFDGGGSGDGTEPLEVEVAGSAGEKDNTPSLVDRSLQVTTRDCVT